MKKKQPSLRKLQLDKRIIGSLGAGRQKLLGGASGNPLCTPTASGCTMFATCPRPNGC
ncbi:class I lanthipeptide [Taibaiella koreensis]|uniref:class I lanthipeptide n=1 Tax=Taibaiella koreensis TaxID=1268548 RepID=UPI0013C2C1B1|nr:class I lanthipeptide [Taibaiella koreensis]